MIAKRSISLLLVILFLMGCGAEEPIETPSPVTTAEKPMETPRALATSEQPLEDEGGGFDWELEYYRLKQKIEAEFGEPEGSPKALEPYLHWMEVKATDRDAVKELYQKALDLSNIDPEDQAIADWIEKFQQLLEYAQESGDRTARWGAWMLMRIEHRWNDQWPSCIHKAKNFGRPLYTKALETGFAYEYVQHYARCLVRYATGDIEVGHLGLYSGRESVFAEVDSEGYLVIPDRDFDVDCERRSEFTILDKGEASAPADKGLEWTNQIREEAEWWGLSFEQVDLTELMEEFYKDVMCRNPSDPGHKWYHELAEQYHLTGAIEHNEGFYATIYGKVEVERGEEREPAPGASVRVYAPKDDEEWTTTANEDGEYRIKRVLLHKDCSPFEISAEYKGDRVDDSFDGPLEEPATAYEFKKDLLLAPKTWKGTLTVKRSINWEREETTDSGFPRKPYVLTEASVTLDFEVDLTHSNFGWDYYHDVVTASGTFVVSFEHGKTEKYHSYPDYWATSQTTLDRCSGTWDEVTVTLNVNEETKQYVLSITSTSSTVCSVTTLQSTNEPGIKDHTGIGEYSPLMTPFFKGSFEGNTISGTWGEPVGEEYPGYGIGGMSDAGSEWTLELTRGGH